MKLAKIEKQLEIFLHLMYNDYQHLDRGVTGIKKHCMRATAVMLALLLVCGTLAVSASAFVSDFDFADYTVVPQSECLREVVEPMREASQDPLRYDESFDFDDFLQKAERLDFSELLQRIKSFDFDEFLWQGKPSDFYIVLVVFLFAFENEADFLRARYHNPWNLIGLTADPYWGVHNMMLNIYTIKQSANLYVYAINNPVMWMDPLGLKIELAHGTTEWQRNQYERALHYLHQSAIFRDLYQLLMDSSFTFTIQFYTFSGDRDGPTFDFATGIIRWDPTGGVRVGDNVMSAAMTLAHEMGHAAQFLEGMFSDGTSRSRIEADVIARFETPIANQLGEFTRRNATQGRMIRMANSTDWGVLNNTSTWYNPFTWGQREFVNRNTWTLPQPATKKVWTGNLQNPVEHVIINPNPFNIQIAPQARILPR